MLPGFHSTHCGLQKPRKADWAKIYIEGEKENRKRVKGRNPGCTGTIPQGRLVVKKWRERG